MAIRIGCQSNPVNRLSNLNYPMTFRLLSIICVAALLIVPFAILLATSGSPHQQESEILQRLCIVQSPAISENSGIIRAQNTDQAIWTHNNSGGKPTVFLFSQKTGKTIGTAQLVDAKNVDWEDIANFRDGEQNFIAVADIGDNLKNRQSYQLFIFSEPELESPDHDEPTVQDFKIKDWTQINFQYEDGPRNSEAISIDFASRQIIIFEKVYVNQKDIPGIYLLDFPDEITDETLTAKRIGQLPTKNITAMDISSDATRIIARTYTHGLLFVRDQEQTWTDAFQNNQPKHFALPLQRQGEGVCFSKDETSILCSSEFKKAPIWKMRIEEDE